MFVVSLLFGLLTNFQLFASRINVPLDDFLALSLFFVVSIFYIFMIDRFNRDAETSAALIQERHNAENISDIARKLSTSLESTDIQMMLVGRFTEIMPGVKCSIVRINSAKDGAEIVASSDPKTPSAVSFDDAPALHEAMQRKDTAVAIVGSGDPNEVGSNSRALDTLAVPMISRDAVIALIYLEKTHDGINPWERSIKFVEIVASTAANALANAERFDKMKQMASTDSLTRLANHGSFKTRLLHEIDRAKRHSRVFSLLLIDLDLLKSINDKFGHPLGDRMIRSVADAIRITCRETDLGARYGGEEFAVILPETDVRGGMQMAERLRQRIEGIDWFPAKITASIGVASFPVDAETGEDLIAVADEAMYVAKSRGRNQVASLTDLV